MSFIDWKKAPYQATHAIVSRNYFEHLLFNIFWWKAEKDGGFSVWNNQVWNHNMTNTKLQDDLKSTIENVQNRMDESFVIDRDGVVYGNSFIADRFIALKTSNRIQLKYDPTVFDVTEAWLKQARLEFIRYTVEHFNVTNRGIDPETGNCSYEGGCAIGRVMFPGAVTRLPNSSIITLGNTRIDSSRSLYDFLPFDIVALGADFLQDIQDLHDYDEHWGLSGLTEYGKGSLNKIEVRYELGE